MGTVPWSALALHQNRRRRPGHGGLPRQRSGRGPLSGLTGLVVGGIGLGFAGQSVKVCGDTVVQRAISDDHRGRVFALYDVVLNIGLVAGVCVVAFTAPPSGLAPWLDVGVAVLLAGTAAWYVVVAPGQAPADVATDPRP